MFWKNVLCLKPTYLPQLSSGPGRKAILQPHSLRPFVPSVEGRSIGMADWFNSLAEQAQQYADQAKKAAEVALIHAPSCLSLTTSFPVPYSTPFL